MTAIFIFLGVTTGTTYLALRLLGTHFDRQSERARRGEIELVNPDKAGEVLGPVEVKEREVEE
ncbi:hypothetical protein N836_31785 [Leptolyngbya sp. Heron Island J]|nr:hypothetical protein N836_31785 [Leptolyngbya sp. Heron Island J]